MGVSATDCCMSVFYLEMSGYRLKCEFRVMRTHIGRIVVWLLIASIAWGRSGNLVGLETGIFYRGKISEVEERKLRMTVNHPIRNNGVYAVPVGNDGIFKKSCPLWVCRTCIFTCGGTVTCFSFPENAINLTVNADSGDY